LPYILAGLVVIGAIIYGITRFFGGGEEVQVETTPTRQVTLTYWGLWEPSSTITETFTEFENQNPGVTVNYVQQSHLDYRDRLQAAIDRDDGPDLFRYHNSWIPMIKDELDTLPSSIMNTEEYNQTFYSVAQNDLNSESSYYGIPLMIEGLGLYYNKDIFQNAGKNPPTTWEEVSSLASELTVVDENDTIQRSGIALGTTTNVDHWPDIIGLMLLQNGADPADPTTETALDAVAFYQLFSTGDNKIWDNSLPNSTYAFAIEKVTMILAPSWRAHEISEINPNLNFAIAPVPQLPNSKVSWASYWVEGVSAQSDDKELAWQLLKFLSDKETLRTFYTAASTERLFGEPFSRVDLADQLSGDPYTAAFVTDAPYAQSWWLSDRTFDNGLNDQIIKYYEDALNAILAGTAPDRALQIAKQGVTQVFSRYGFSPSQ